MARVKVTTTVESEKLKEIKKRNLEVSKLLDAAIDGVLSDNEPFYADELLKAIRERENIESILSTAQSNRDRWGERASVLEVRKHEIDMNIARIRYQSESSIRSKRISQLLREINSAIVYNDYNAPDIELAVSSQLRELRNLSPDFNLKKQIENLQHLNV